MNIGFVGLGMLGYPVATAIAAAGHRVMGFDIRPDAMVHDSRAELESGPNGVESFNDWSERTDSTKKLFTFGSLAEIAAHADIVFVAVPTPHGPEFEGITPLPDTRVDFDYTALRQTVSELSRVIERPMTIGIISTCIPGTVRRELLPLCSPLMHLVYNPSFIAMGTAVRDYYEPEFVLLGSDEKAPLARMTEFYAHTVKAPVRCMSVESAELAKMMYNTFISMKLAFSNSLLEICHAIPEADIEDVTGVLKAATRRLIAPSYMDGGMGDGGACHPRDNIAMSWMAKEIGLRRDIFADVMLARQAQAEWLADLMERYDLPKAIVGFAYKPNTNIITGSHSILVKNILEARGHSVAMWDPLVAGDASNEGPLIIKGVSDTPSAVLLGCKHDAVTRYRFAEGSIIIDPFRVFPPQGATRVVRLGEGEVSAEGTG